jgi:hypothetical protein
MWSSSSVKRVFTKIEKEASEEIACKTTSRKYMGEKVDGVYCDPEELFNFQEESVNGPLSKKTDQG